MAVQAQWDLGLSVGSALSFTTKLLHAATTDNVQPTVLATCENFGATLPMSEETIRTIETLIRDQTQSGILRVAQLAIGYAARDSTSYLSKSSGGIRFLGLAAALLSITTAYHAASAVEILLQNSTSRQNLLPTKGQLCDLLKVIDKRCHATRYLDRVVFWKLFLLDQPGLAVDVREVLLNHYILPSKEGIDKLVALFRRLNRIGVESKLSVTITTSGCAPWIIAFTTWCIGTPSVFCDNSPQALTPLGGRVTVIIDTLGHEPYGLQIAAHSSAMSPADILHTTSERSIHVGLLSVQEYARFEVRRLCHTRAMRSALQNCCQYVLPYVLAEIRLIPYANLNLRSTWTGTNTEPAIDEFSTLRLNPFPSKGVVSRMMSIFFDEDLDMLASPVNESVLQTIEPFLLEIEQHCECRYYNSPAKKKHECERKIFEQALSSAVAMILVLSLFDRPEKLMVDPYHNHEGLRQLATSIESIFRGSFKIRLAIPELLRAALFFVGHGAVTRDFRSWIISSHRGQVVYLAIHESNIVEKNGFLILAIREGVVRCGEEEFNQGLVPQSLRFEPFFLEDYVEDKVSMIRFLKDRLSDKVSQPCNLFSDHRTMWRITPCEDFLEMAHTMVGPAASTRRDRVSNEILLQNLASTIFVESCEHSPARVLCGPDRQCAYTLPLRPIEHYPDEGIPTLGIVPVAGDDRLRLFALSAGESPFVLRGKACLDCCIQICRKAGYSSIIL